jgi:uncharacterized protein (DUF2252 family)
MSDKSVGWTPVKDRAKVLTALRREKMAKSAHAFVRGSTAKFYEWLKTSSVIIPEGPPVWICGDCHIGNLGPIANAKERVHIEIRDLDQTVIGNPAHDLIRLGLSLASAARGSDLPGVLTSLMLEALIDGYEAAFDEGEDAMVEIPSGVQAAMDRSLNRKWKHLAAERIEGRPGIPLGRNFWPLMNNEHKAIAALFDDERARRLVTALRSRDEDAQIEVLDAAYWVKGCSSLGNVRYAALIGIAGEEGELCLMDIKEAVTALAPRDPNAKMPRDNAERVAEGAWHLAPALGERLLPGRILDHSVFIRELLPQDLKFEIAHLTSGEAVRVARYLALVVGKAHARQMQFDTRASWQAELRRNRTKTLDAPSWLWSSVVELIMAHEGAYLDHCRRYASRGDADAS